MTDECPNVRVYSVIWYVTLNDSELRLAKYALLRFGNMLIAKELPTEDVNALLLKLYK